MKVLTVLGARPQFIKASAVSRELRNHEGVHEVLVHTGQHYDDNMSNVFFRELDIPDPKHHLGIGSGMHGDQTGRMLSAIEKVLVEEKPDWLMVYGDTNSTLAGALAAAKLDIPIAHVEAGLRSYNRRMPEEINRVLTDHLAALLFAPTSTAVENLRKEGIASGKVRLVGDVMYDCAIHSDGRSGLEAVAELGLRSREYALATIHRAENTDDPASLHGILTAMASLAAEMPVLWPIHPRTRKKVFSDPGLTRLIDGIKVVDPLGYLDMMAVEKAARVVLTDSGGVQKEAFFHRTPCVTVRGETEWVELVDLGWNQLVSPTDPEAIVSAALNAKEGAAPPHGLYGGGQASREIVRHLRAG